MKDGDRRNKTKRQKEGKKTKTKKEPVSPNPAPPDLAYFSPPLTIIIEKVTHGKIHLLESGTLINVRDIYGVPKISYTGSSVTIAVLDTGIDTDHPDLQDDILWQECFLSGGGCPGSGGTRASGQGSAEDDHGHGTHVSGIITSSQSAWKGIAPDAKIVAIKIADSSGNDSPDDVIAAIDWIVSHKDTYGIKVINMSFGDNPYTGNCDGDEFAYADAVDAAKNEGIVLFAASGNDAYSSKINVPACLSSVISVGAVYDANVGVNSSTGPPPGLDYSKWCIDWTTEADQIACFSNVASVLDILAPGSEISSTDIAGYNNRFGTSMASPHAAAVAALMLQKNQSLSPGSIEVILKITGKSIYDSRISMSFPRIDALAALNSVAPPTITSFSVTPNSLTSGNAFTINYCVTDDIGLKQVELLRATDTNGDGQPDWSETSLVNTTTLSGQASYCSSFTDAPQASGTYWYGIHAVDIYDIWNDEQNSITGGSPGDYGPIQVTVTSDTTCTDSYESNDSSSQAYGPMSSGSNYSGKVCTSTDADWYKVNLSSAGTISLSLSVPTSNDYDLQLYNPSYSWVAESYNGTGISEAITYSAATTGTYYIRVYSPSGSYNTTSSYTLSYNFTTGTVPTVTTSTASSITSTSATLSGSINPNGSSTNAWFEWGTSSNLSTYNSTPLQSVGSGTTSQSISASLSGLSPSTTYYYRAAASNNGGTSRV